MSYFEDNDLTLRISEDEMQIVQLIRNLTLKY